MQLRATFKTRPTLSEAEVASSLRWMVREAVSSIGYGSITTSGFLAAYALALGANNFQVGVLAALPFLTQPLQIPSIFLVEKFRNRKFISFASWLAAQIIWIPVALIPVYIGVPGAPAVSALLGLVALRGVFSAVTNTAWNSWIRDLIPQSILGSFFARRLAMANLVAMIFGLAAALFVDFWLGRNGGGPEALAYTFPLLIGAMTLGLATPMFMLFMPEPEMPRHVGTRESLLTSLKAPFTDSNYKHLIRFHFLWGLALNLATPFFAIYMLQRLGLPLSAVIGFSILAQGVNVLFMRVWGPLVDRLGAKPVLSVSASLYLLAIMGWIFTTMPERYFLTIPLLVFLHFLMGAASAGVTLTTGMIGLKLAPQGGATAYIAAASLAANLGAGLGPLLGGQFADFFSVRELGLQFTWVDPSNAFDLTAISLTGFDFLFGLSVVLGLLTLNLLTALKEEGELSREMVLESLHAPVREISRPLSSVPGLSFLTHFPYGYLRRVPLPGLDVAVGVTAYQLADITRTAIHGAIAGRRASMRVAEAMERTVSEAWDKLEISDGMEAEFASHAVRGAFHSTDDIPDRDASLLAGQYVSGAVKAMSGSADIADTVSGAVQGAMEGAIETGGDVASVAARAVTAATAAARESGFSDEDVVSAAMESALSVAESLEPEETLRVREALESLD
ncbi:MAG: MFS transporter [Dehalococcoidia bacterium]